MDWINIKKEPIKVQIKEYLSKLIETITNLSLDEIEKFYNILLECYYRKNNIFVFGNGGSAATASHFAVDINKGANTFLRFKFKVICLNDNIPTILAIANDNDVEEIFVKQLKNFVKKGDVVIGISGSGISENIISAIKYANKIGAITVGITGYDGGKLKKIAHHSLNANINDMQISEDIHLIFSHIIMRLLSKNIYFPPIDGIIGDDEED